MLSAIEASAPCDKASLTIVKKITNLVATSCIGPSSVGDSSASHLSPSKSGAQNNSPLLLPVVVVEVDNKRSNATAVTEAAALLPTGTSSTR